MARQFVCSKNEPVVQTKAGKLRGFIQDGTYTFHGIKYADAKRFQAPEPVEPWDGVKDALSYGFVCPLLHQDTPSGEVMIPHRYWPFDENCQYLNVWTQSVDPKAKKPVLVWLHGGGFAAGSSIEHVAYDGENMSKYGDVVVVSINHRLNILGYLDLSSFGEKYRNSGNAGNDDMVAALQWIHDNIENFGGDPENVTLFGQSGGGMKVWALMQTPAADGLFHKGIVQSGVIDGFVPEKKVDGTKIVNALLAELGLKEAKELEGVPYSILAEAYNKVSPALEKAGEYVGNTPIPNEFYMGDPRVVGFTEHARTIPLMVGTVFGEFSFGPAIAAKASMPEEKKLELLKKKYGENTERFLRLFRAAYPQKDITDLLFVDTLFRAPTKDFIEKASHNSAPVYSYLFTYEFPYDGGHVAWHCAEIPYTFHNTDKVPVCNEPGVSDRLEEQVFGAWVNFAKYGDPGHAALPQWPASKPGDEAVMLFDRVCELKHNFDHNLVDAVYAVAPRFGEEEPEAPIQH